jgi:SNF2 family DNA or RNA helicase
MDTQERERIVDAFQSDPDSSVLLLSLQAGGVGITLTAATHEHIVGWNVEAR